MANDSHDPGRPISPAELVRLSRGGDASRYARDPRRSSSVGSSNSRRPRPRLPTRAEHEAAFRRDCDEQGIRFNARGCETSYQALRTAVRRGFARGELAFKTTNGQRAAALRNAGRARCERTVQRHHRRLERMGLLMATHVKRRKMELGRRDCLHLRLLTYVAPSEAGGPTATPSGPSTATAQIEPPELAPLPAPAALNGNGNGSTEQANTESELNDAEAAWAQSVLGGFDDPPEVRQRRLQRAEDERRRRILGRDDE